MLWTGQVVEKVMLKLLGSSSDSTLSPVSPIRRFSTENVMVGFQAYPEGAFPTQLDFDGNMVAMVLSNGGAALLGMKDKVRCYLEMVTKNRRCVMLV
jgi:hypothetical protein